MAAESEMKFPEVIWYGKTEYSPKAAKAGFALDFALHDVVADGKAISGLFGYYRVSVNFAGKYTVGFPSPIFLVALSASDGTAYVRDIVGEDGDVVGLHENGPQPSIRRIDATGAPIPGPEIFESGFFNVDIARHLGLPAKADRYAVFLWLEDRVSDIRILDLPKDLARGASFDVSGGRSGTLRAVASQAKSPGVMAIRLYGQGKERAIQGRVCLDAPVSKDRPLPLSLIAATYKERRTVWTGLDAAALAGASGCVDFQVSLQALGLDRLGDERFFAIALLNGKRSNILDSAAAPN